MRNSKCNTRDLYCNAGHKFLDDVMNDLIDFCMNIRHAPLSLRGGRGREGKEVGRRWQGKEGGMEFCFDKSFVLLAAGIWEY